MKTVRAWVWAFLMSKPFNVLELILVLVISELFVLWVGR